MLKLSPSKISTYKLCPFKYKCDTDYLVRNAYRKDTPDLTFGNLIHGCLNDYFKRVDESERNFETLRKLFEEKFKKHFEKHKMIFRTKENIIKYVEESKRQFKIFISSELAKGDPFLIEEFPKYIINSDLELGGKFDRVDLVNGELILIDYKTGKFRDDKKDDIKFQMDFYEYLLLKKYPEYKVSRKILFYLKENKQVEEELVINIDDVEKEIINMAKIIENDKELKPRRNPLCNFCDYKIICPLFKVN